MKSEEAVISENDGYLPVAIDYLSGRITWHDLAQYHIYEGMFHRAVKMYGALQKSHASQKLPPLESQLTDLLSIHIPARQPDLIIAHMSRCGSTLLSGTLAQSREHNVFGEPGLVFPILYQARQRGLSKDEQCSYLIKAFSLLGRHRVPSHRKFIVKLSSLESYAIPTLQEAFPTTPILFLYRDPIEVIVSNLEKPASFMKAQVNLWRDNIIPDQPSQDTLLFLTEHVENCMSEALQARCNQIQLLDYKQITAAYLENILSLLDLQVSGEDQLRMVRQFDNYSKAPWVKKLFTADGKAKQIAASSTLKRLCQDRLTHLYEELCQSQHNLLKAY